MFLFALLAAATLFTILPPSPVYAQADSAAELIAEVNAYRSANGLVPYVIDSYLMGQAQTQAEYQAVVGTCTHVRADGSGPGDHNIASENVACGLNLSASTAIYSQWTDAQHSATMLGPDEGLVGAGVATSGGNVFYTLDVNATKGNFTYRPPKSNDQPTALPGQSTFTPNAQPVVSGPFFTSTPNGDGSVSHVVQYGQTLIQIADTYGISLSTLYAQNPSIDPNKPVYFAGQVLIIKPAFTATPVVTATLTPRPPTRTARPTRTATIVHTPTSTRTMTATPSFRLPKLDDWGPNQKYIAYGFIILSAIGLILVVLKGFIKAK
jgi:uncharacterized protein YkwD